MPSLIYITRIQPLSAELAQALESSSVHVKSFGPGEITADECVLVMTSEAVSAGLRSSGLGSLRGAGGAEGTKSRGAPPLQEIQKHLGADAAIWDCIKAGGVSESAAVESRAAAEQRPSVSALVPAPDHMGFVASQAGVRALGGLTAFASGGKKGAGEQEQCRRSWFAPAIHAESNRPTGASRCFPLEATRLLKEIRSVDGQRPRGFWQPAAMAAALLVLAVVLLAARASILPSTAHIVAVDNRNPDERPDPGAAGLIHGSSTVRSSTRASNLPAGDRRHISDYDFVAEDSTTHFDRACASRSDDSGSRPPARSA